MATFPTTPWSSVSAAGDPSTPTGGAALTKLCRSYWYPIYSFIRSRGYPPDESADLTQEYFGRLLASRLLESADHRKGRFRALLLTDCRYFLADQQEQRQALKRGADRNQLSLDTGGGIDAEAAERRYCLKPSNRLDPERLFDRAWALDLLARALDRLSSVEVEAGRGASFERLRTVLTSGPRVIPYATLAADLGITDVAVEAAVRRLRARYREAVRAEVAATLDDPSEAEVDDEIRALFAALAP